jgi:hypothetical protein
MSLSTILIIRSLGIMTLSIVTVSIMTLSIVTLSIKDSVSNTVMLSVVFPY